ncbi:MAG: hypothetical protein KAI66_25990 [Lentisphaeria bacterium]|nr:hypothetical protein [Lentisphaeria bacterium]
MTWKRSEIRAARQKPLKSLMEALGYQLLPLQDGNYQLCKLAADIVVKDHYWVNKQDGTAGNAIDFLVNVEGMSFNQAMGLLRS